VTQDFSAAPSSDAPAEPEFADPEAAEDFAASVGVDPTPEDVKHYLEMEGEA
jgi:hypothetical protein